MLFENREDAGRQLAAQLTEFANRQNTIVLGIPRGGVIVAAAVAEALHLPLDIFLSHKLGVPGHEELAFGAIAAGSSRYLDPQIIHNAHIAEADIDRVTAQTQLMLARRGILYRGNRPPLAVTGRTILLADDGIATGASVYAAIQALRQSQPAALIVAVPVAPASTCAWLRSHVDRLVCLHSPADFFAVGQFFRDFPQFEDGEIIAVMRHQAETQPS